MIGLQVDLSWFWLWRSQFHLIFLVKLFKLFKLCAALFAPHAAQDRVARARVRWLAYAFLCARFNE